MKEEIKEYAKKILKNHGCKLSTYWRETGETIIGDLKEAYPNGMEYPYLDVANAILAITEPEPLKRAPYRMIFDIGHTVDGIDHESMEAAKTDALDTLIEWMSQFTIENHISQPDPKNWTKKQQEDWDYMIYNFSVCVAKYDPQTDEYITCWEPTAEDEKSVGWILAEEYPNISKKQKEKKQ